MKNKRIIEPISNLWIYNSLLAPRANLLYNPLNHLSHGGISSWIKYVTPLKSVNALAQLGACWEARVTLAELECLHES